MQRARTEAAGGTRSQEVLCFLVAAISQALITPPSCPAGKAPPLS